MAFPDGFRWGVATASYQIEGSPVAVGGGASVWDMFCHRPGKVFEGDSGYVACDHYNRFREDVALMKELGIPAYRLSISWPRVMPNGTGEVSEEGLAFYDSLIDALLEAGIEPHITLFHWDFPYELYIRGGWLNPDSPQWFADYTAVLMDRFSDRVSNWMTLNEPQCFIGLGLQSGQHAPGDKLGDAELALAAHHTLLAHGRAVQVIREKAKTAPRIGWAPVGVTKVPFTDSPDDVEAARKSMFESKTSFIWSNSWWNDPIFFGKYPEDGLAYLGKHAPKIKAGDMEIISQPIDFFGCNIYNAVYVKAGENGEPVIQPYEPGIGRTIYHWPVTPSCLYWGPKFFYERYGLPIVITENGMGSGDWIDLDGRVKDAYRVDYLKRHLLEFERACSEGVPVEGYFQWSLMDNFEWNEGYRFRFGLVHVDYKTQVRTPKDSAYWYRDLIASNGTLIHT